jgi:hemerythrin-like domain-containing protein
MTSVLTLHEPPAAGFDEPFEMLTACHERAERMLRLLERLAQHLGEVGCDANAKQAARDIMRYFDTAGPAHHEDEERHLFPVLIAQGAPDMVALVERLRHEHESMSEQWETLRVDLDQLNQGTWPVQTLPEALPRWDSFAALYRSHIAAEETHVYPAARQSLDSSDCSEMGREMAQRRAALWTHR